MAAAAAGSTAGSVSLETYERLHTALLPALRAYTGVPTHNRIQPTWVHVKLFAGLLEVLAACLHAVLLPG